MRTLVTVAALVVLASVAVGGWCFARWQAPAGERWIWVQWHLARLRLFLVTRAVVPFAVAVGVGFVVTAAIVVGLRRRRERRP